MAQDPTINIPAVNVGNFTFLFPAMIGIEWEAYEVGNEQREIRLLLAGPHEHTFIGSDADEFKFWFDTITGQQRIQPASGTVGPTRLT